MFTLKENKLNINFELIGGSSGPSAAATADAATQRAEFIKLIASLSNEGDNANLIATITAIADNKPDDAKPAPGGKPIDAVTLDAARTVSGVSITPVVATTTGALSGLQKASPVDNTAQGASTTDNTPDNGNVNGPGMGGGAVNALTSQAIALVNSTDFVANIGVTPQEFAKLLIQLGYYANGVAVLAAINAPAGNDLAVALSAGDLEKWVRAGDDSHLEITKNGKTMNLADYWSEPGSKGNVTAIGELGTCFNQSTSGNFSSASRPECDALVVTPGAPGSDYAKLAALSQENVNKISPAVLFGVLKYLGFQMANNNGLNEVQTYASWWTNLKQEDKEKLKPDVNLPHGLKPFLEKAIAFINGNPAILNKGVESKCEDKAGYGLRCTKGKHNPRSFDEFRNQIDLTLNRFRGIPAGLMGVGAVGYQPYGLTGGAAVPIGLLPSGTGSVGRLPEFTKQVRALYAGFVSRLESMKKTLSASTKSQIEDVFKQTQDKENEAKKLLGWFEKYAQSTQMTGDRTPAVYGTQELKSASDNFAKVLGKYRRRLYSLVDIVSVASQAVNDAELKSMSM